jgi:hypothetical protein
LEHQFLNIKLLTAASLIGLLYNIVIILTMHRLRPDLSPISRYISEYAIGKFRFMAASSIFVYGIAILGICLCIISTFSKSDIINTGLIMIAIWGIAKVISSFYKVDLKGSSLTLQGVIHNIAAGIGIITSVVGLIILGNGFIYDPDMYSLAKMTQIVAIMALILSIIFFTGVIGDILDIYNIKSPGIILKLANITGIIERILLVISVVWLSKVAFWIFAY